MMHGFCGVASVGRDRQLNSGQHLLGSGATVLEWRASMSYFVWLNEAAFLLDPAVACREGGRSRLDSQSVPLVWRSRAASRSMSNVMAKFVSAMRMEAAAAASIIIGDVDAVCSRCCTALHCTALQP